MEQSWDAECDVVVIGYGGAGVTAAIEAADGGASVIAIDRYGGGGATALSGGVVYAGGGTKYQTEAGFEDSPENMFNYLSQEVGDVVSPELLREFCESSSDLIDWLGDKGVPFEASFCPFKTSYPTDDYFLYYSGNEQAMPYSQHADPAPRGHRTKGKGTSGKVLFKHLDAAARARGVDVRIASRATRLITEGDKVIGVEYTTIDPEKKASRNIFERLSKANGKMSMYFPPAAKLANMTMARMERSGETTIRVRARGGVVLSAGGFAFNQEMMKTYAPKYAAGRPLGTIADDGTGIKLGQEVGGDARHLGNITAWRFYCPPEAMMAGLLLDKNGDRVCNEDLYGAAIGRHMVEDHGGQAWLIIDQKLFDEVKGQVNDQTMPFQRVQLKWLLSRGAKSGDSPKELASEIGMSAEGLEAALVTYNEGLQSGNDAWGKQTKFHRQLTSGPYYAFDCSLENSNFFPCPVLTLGGLGVEESSGRVLRTDDSVIEGLYAAGRNAIGVASNNYVSGLSVADCFFSGRRAGRHASATAKATSSKS